MLNYEEVDNVKLRNRYDFWKNSLFLRDTLNRQENRVFDKINSKRIKLSTDCNLIIYRARLNRAN